MEGDSYLEHKIYRDGAGYLNLKIEGRIFLADRKLYQLGDHSQRVADFRTGNEDTPRWERKIKNYLNIIFNRMNLDSERDFLTRSYQTEYIVGFPPLGGFREYLIDVQLNVQSLPKNRLPF